MRGYFGSTGAVVLVSSLAAVCAVAAEAEGVKSGPQPGEPFAGAFNVKAVTGDVAGQTLCFT